MKKYILAAALAAAPLMAATSAQAITVQQGSQLSITITGQYQTRSGGNVTAGSILDVVGAQVGFFSVTGPGVDLDGLSNFSTVTFSGPITLSASANTGLELGFATTGGAVFTVGNSFNALVDGTGAVGTQGLSAVGEFDPANDGSFRYTSSSLASSNLFQITLDVPPTIEEPDPISPIPLPAAGWALFAALGSLVAFRRYSKA